MYACRIGRIVYTRYSPLARAVVRDAIDLLPRVALTSGIFSYSFQPAACPDATSSTDTAIDPTNACEYTYMRHSPNTCEHSLVVRVGVRVGVHCAGPYNRQLNSWAPTRCIHSSLYAPPWRMHVRAIIITRIPIVNYRSARSRKGICANQQLADPRHDSSNVVLHKVSQNRFVLPRDDAGTARSKKDQVQKHK